MRTYQHNLISNLNKWLKRKSRRIKDEHLQAALTLLILDLEPARKYLQSLYSPNPRRPHYDPVCMLRALLLMTLLGFKSYTLWSKELRNKPRLAVIALNPRKGTHPSPSGSAKNVNEDGIPVCPAGMLMRLCGHVKKKHRIIYNCPVKRPTHRDGQHTWNTFVDECPHKTLCDTRTKMGPVVYVKSTDDPRLYPPLPRNSLKFHKLMDKRSCCERSNSTKKVTYHLGERPCRSDAHYLVRLYLVSIIEHARAWLSEEMKLANNDPLALIKKVKVG